MNGCMLPLARMIQMKVEVIDYIVNTAWIIPIYGCDKYPEILFSLLDKLIVSSKIFKSPKPKCQTITVLKTPSSIHPQPRFSSHTHSKLLCFPERQAI
mmetsp:Transcript_22697/g.54791  ORF Transcript_22697/g.54791 Transcript_22697/m.54791 type:complete len:98 (-) Transcript_22697:329-622(-)